MLYIISLLIMVVLSAAFWVFFSWSLCRPYRRKIKCLKATEW